MCLKSGMCGDTTLAVISIETETFKTKESKGTLLQTGYPEGAVHELHL